MTSAFAEPLFVIKLDPRAATGACLPTLGEAPATVLQRNAVAVESAGAAPVPAEVARSLANVVHAIEKIGRGNFAHHRELSVVFEASWGYSWHTFGTREIHISPGSQNLSRVADKRFGGTNNVGMLAHEIAHYISARDDFRIQNAYNAFTSEACRLTGYSRTNRVEEFAEVFAAFVTNPDLLAGRGHACERARRYLMDLFGEPPEGSAGCEARRRAVTAPR